MNATRGHTTAGTNSGSFKAHAHDEAQFHLEPDVDALTADPPIDAQVQGEQARQAAIDEPRRLRSAWKQLMASWRHPRTSWDKAAAGGTFAMIGLAGTGIAAAPVALVTGSTAVAAVAAVSLGVVALPVAAVAAWAFLVRP